MATNQGCKSLIPKDGLDFSFLYYYLKANVEILESLGTGTTFKELSGTQLKTVQIPVPPLVEQKRIVALLDAATARVAELTACYEDARTYANDLFASALRDALERNQSAPLRTLDELCEEGIVKLGRGNIISKKDIAAKPGSYPIYSSARENEGKFGEYGDYMFDEEMITWSIDGGGRLFYRSKHKFSVTNVGGTLRVLDAQLLDIQYLHRVLQNLHSQRVFDWVFKAHPSVIRKVYDAIPMPPLDEQMRIVARLDSMRAKTSEMVAAFDAKLVAAKNLHQSILESAFAGEL
jgi:type I restriction enzyme S subunit